LLKPKSVAIASGTLLEVPRSLPPFTLTGDDGKPFTNANLAGHWTLVFAGFTSCPDVCPTTLTLLKGVLADLGPRAQTLKVLLLSVD
ncbi:SCO family protein, partial [Acinetobacter baumannii]